MMFSRLISGRIGLGAPALGVWVVSPLLARLLVSAFLPISISWVCWQALSMSRILGDRLSMVFWSSSSLQCLLCLRKDRATTGLTPVSSASL